MLGVWFAVVIVSCLTWYSAGWPGAVMVVVVTAALNHGKGINEFLRTFRDWTMILLFFVGYTASRSLADSVGFPVQEQLLIDVDRLIGFGDQPVHRAQRLVDWTSRPQWWEGTFPVMYTSHFVASMVPMALAYRQNKPRAVAFMQRWMLLSIIGLTGYVLFPTRPPWMSSDRGRVDTVYSGLARGWEVLGSQEAASAFDRGTEVANQIAAMPSLHAGYAMLLFIFWGLGSRKWLVRVSVGAYALYMGFVIVITGQHWLIDVFAGWACALAAHLLVSRYEQHKLIALDSATAADAQTTGDVASSEGAR